MSGFRDTFTKEDKGENMLDYDESAFYYFAAVVLTGVFIPVAWTLIRNIVWGPKDSETAADIKSRALRSRCKCSLCQDKVSPTHTPKPSRISCRNFCHFLLFLTLAFALGFSFQQIATSSQGEIRRFDPFAILEIPAEATDKDIKSAYRRLSLKYHPDKNPGDTLAMGHFMQITKAYEALTDPRAKENYLKYGNPDGPQPMRFAIGMPRFFLEAENQVAILVIFFLVLLVLIPGAVLLWIRRASSLDPNGCLIENQRVFYGILSENMQYKRCAWLIAAASEFQSMPLRKSDQVELNKLRRDYEESIPKKKNWHPRFIKNLLLIYTHLSRRTLSQGLIEDQKILLEKAGSLLESAVEQGFSQNLHPRMRRTGLRALTMIIEYSQLITQGLREHEPSVLMCPHITDTTVKDIPKDRQNIEKLRTGPLPEKLVKRLSQDQMEDLKAALAYFPRYVVTPEVYVPDVTDNSEGSKDIAEGDLITVKVKIERFGGDGQSAPGGLVHSQRFPWGKTEKLWLLIGDTNLNRVYYIKKINTVEALVEDNDFKFVAGSRIPPFGIGAGEHTFDIIVKSDSYYGLDVSERLTFKILPENSVDKTVFVHEEDQKLDNEPTMLQSLLMGGKGEEKESDDEELPELAAGVQADEDEDDMD